MFIRVLAGFLAGIAAGVLLMRSVYKKSSMKGADLETLPSAGSTTTTSPTSN
jgi:hypothetical protein